MTRSTKILLLIVLIGGLYLLVSYGAFYFFIGRKNLKSPFSTNTFSIQESKGAKSIKYVALGDSLTAGVGSDTVEDTFVYGFARLLAQNNKEVVVTNLGIPGATTNELISLELQTAINANPNIITLLIGVNDIHNKSSTAKFRENLWFILNQLLTRTDSQILVLTIPYLGSNKLLLPPLNYIMDFRTRQFNKVIAAAVESQNNGRVQVIDIYSGTYDVAKNDPKYYSSDLYHPSGYGYRVWRRFLNVN